MLSGDRSPCAQAITARAPKASAVCADAARRLAMRLARRAERARPAVELAAKVLADFVDQLAQRFFLARRRRRCSARPSAATAAGARTCPCSSSSRSTAAGDHVELRREVVDPELDQLRRREGQRARLRLRLHVVEHDGARLVGEAAIGKRELEQGKDAVARGVLKVDERAKIGLGLLVREIGREQRQMLVGGDDAAGPADP